MRTPFFPAWRPFLAPRGPRPQQVARSFGRATLCQIEHVLARALPPELLQKPAAGEHSRRRVFCLRRTFWCWIWQIFQRNTSCRQVVRQIQAMLSLLQQPPIDQDSSAYCQARAKVSLDLLEKAFQASALSAQKLAPSNSLLQGRPIKIVDASTVRLEDTPENRLAYPPSRNQFSKPSFPILKFLVLFGLATGAVLARATGSLQWAKRACC